MAIRIGEKCKVLSEDTGNVKKAADRSNYSFLTAKSCSAETDLSVSRLARVAPTLAFDRQAVTVVCPVSSLRHTVANSLFRMSSAVFQRIGLSMARSVEILGTSQRCPRISSLLLCMPHGAAYFDPWHRPTTISTAPL